MEHYLRSELLKFKNQYYSELFDEVNSETHITFDLKTIGDVEDFKAYCAEHNIKLIGIEMKDTSGQPMYQFMVTKRLKSTLRDLHHVLCLLDHRIEGFEANRLKVEVDFSSMPEQLKKHIMYYEMHLTCNGDTPEKARIIADYVADLGYKRSNNITKDVPETSCLLTKRYPIENSNVFDEYQKLRDMGVTASKLEIEAIIFDSNVDLDKDW